MTPEKIMIIDDNPANIGLLSEGLERKGHEILTASDGDSGIRIAGMAEPALILLDVMMPLQDRPDKIVSAHPAVLNLFQTQCSKNLRPFFLQQLLCNSEVRPSPVSPLGCFSATARSPSASCF
jgi:Response regulator receiver domain